MMVGVETQGAKVPAVPGYPASWEFDGLLINGEAVLVRPIQPADAALLVSFYAKLRPQSIQWRNFGIHPTITPGEASRSSEVDYSSRIAFVAVMSDELIGFASYDRLGPTDRGATIDCVVTNAYQNHGVATLLFESLGAYARTKGIECFVSTVKAENTDMLKVLGATGLDTKDVHEEDSIRVEIDLRTTPEYRAICDERESTAEAASITAILRPRSIAVIGTGPPPGKQGDEVVRSLLAGDFSGTVYPISPSARAIHGVPAFPTLASLPEQVDLALVAVPSTQLLGVIAEAVSTGVRAVAVMSAGPDEASPLDVDAATELLTIARRHGMRIVGPNCFGVVNTDPEVQMSALSMRLDLLPGRLALVSQSSTVGILLAEQTIASGVGLSSLVSVGNKLDVSSNDLLCFFEHDERTSVIALYLESFGNPRKFARIARRVGEHKPIVALKVGRTSGSTRGPRSHDTTPFTPELRLSALLRGAGVIQVDRLEELLDVSTILLAGPLPAGRRVALVGNSDGLLVLAANACEAAGLIVPELNRPTRIALEKIDVGARAVTNPIDLAVAGTAANLEQALEIVLHDDAIDAVIVLTTNLPALSAPEARAVVVRIRGRSGKPVIACVLGEHPRPVSGEGGALAEILSPERAAIALGHVCRYAEWRRSSPSSALAREESFDDKTIREIVASALARTPTGGWLDLADGAGLLEACRVPVLASGIARNADEAVSVAESFGYPVALKTPADVGDVVSGLESPVALRDAFEAIASGFGAETGGAVIQPMAPPGIEMRIGLVADPVLGPVVMVGLGGMLTDLLNDHAFAVPPFDADTADEMVRSLRAAPLLGGYRGTPAVDRKALVELLETIASIAERVPELVELDLNPIVVTPTGTLVVDYRARVAPCETGPGPLFRSLHSRTQVAP